ncbi:phosphorothioated DNA-binding restriction endonuclease [Neobacillus pocheonensis]|uniref:phosphorothioated DNA-binding restriction endonuclease n=1 Tax=Neobacillus pocheonensis TaxID=363869 RepID=UPI003D2D34EE
MNGNELKQNIQNISIWKKGDQRAPHNPLLLLYALGKIQNEVDRFLPYKEVKEKLTSLLIEFGPKRKSYHPEEPFVRLSNDGIWDFNTVNKIDTKNPSNRFLLENQVSGGFNKEAYNLLKADKALIKEVAEIILNNHFPDTIHEDILTSIGLDLEFVGKRRRDPNFRERVLKAYEYSCAVCGFHVRLGHNIVGLEAAHIKWHQAGGPDTETNGIALCSMHHKLFDRGVFTLTEEKVFLLAEEAHGFNGFNEWLMKFHDKPIRKPIHPDYLPSQNFLHWHVREVFRGPSRYIVG